MNRLLVVASLAAITVVAPAMAFAQTEGASTYSDTVPKKSSAHHASGQKAHTHGTHKHSTHKHHTKSKTKKASASTHKSAAK